MPPEPNNSESRIAKARKRARDVAALEPDAWAIYGSSASDYERSLNVHSLGDVIARRREQQLPVNVLDFMGDGQVLSDLDIDNGLAVTLSDIRSGQRKREDRQASIHLVAGNILDKDTWREMKDWLKNNTANWNFDIILSRPVAGMDMIPSDPRLYYQLVNRLYRMLSPDGGTIYTQIPLAEWPVVQTIERWIDFVSQTQGIDSHYDELHAALTLTRHPDSPDNLPKLQ